jgi:hypothetical protein
MHVPDKIQGVATVSGRPTAAVTWVRLPLHGVDKNLERTAMADQDLQSGSLFWSRFAIAGHVCTLPPQ